MDFLKPKPMGEKVDELKLRYLKLEEQMKDMEFYKECCVEKFVQEARGFFSPRFPSASDFYKTLLDEKNEKYKQNIRFVQDILRQCLAKDIKITNFIAMGYEMYGISIHFNANKKEYELIVPIPQNISRHCIVSSDGNFIHWDICKFQLLERESECSLRTVWTGYDIEECDYFKEKEDGTKS